MDAQRIKIINIFKSIDGEAYHAGLPTIFLRTYGCNLRCAYNGQRCDTPESWSMEAYNKLYDRPLRELAPEDALQEIIDLDPNIKHATITGGEPLLPENQEWMKQLTARLLAKGYEVDFETNGAVDLVKMAEWRDSLGTYAERVHFIMDWKCPGSAMVSKMIPFNLAVLKPWDVVKCVVCDGDFDEVLAVRERLDSRITIYVSPAFGGVDMKSIPEFVLAHTDLNLKCQLQQHKYFWDPMTKDV